MSVRYGFSTLLTDRYHQNARSQAPAWERTASEARPRACPIQNLACTVVRQAEPAIQWVPRQSLGTSRWRSARSAGFSAFLALSVFVLFSAPAYTQSKTSAAAAKPAPISK